MRTNHPPTLISYVDNASSHLHLISFSLVIVKEGTGYLFVVIVAVLGFIGYLIIEIRHESFVMKSYPYRKTQLLQNMQLTCRSRRDR